MHNPGRLIFPACKHEIPGGGGGSTNNQPTGGDQPCSPDSVYFVNQVLPLLLSNCAMSGCHDAITRANGVQLTSYTSIMQTADVRPGNPGGSDLYEVLNETDPDKIMPRPPASPFTAAQKDIIYRWIQQGARNNACNDCDTTSFTYSAAISNIISNSCLGCHNNANAGLYGAGISLEGYNNLKTQGLNGKLYAAVSHTGPYPMPKGGSKLSDCRIKQIKKWIDSNYPN